MNEGYSFEKRPPVTVPGGRTYRVTVLRRIPADYQTRRATIVRTLARALMRRSVDPAGEDDA